MIAVIQRVKRASVTIEDTVYSEIKQGILILLGVEKGDTHEQADFLSNKICGLRFFEDENEKMNLSVQDIQGELLVVSQFTLAGNCKKGKRPSFDNAAAPDEAIPLYEYFVKSCQENNLAVKTGKFGASMEVALVNDGPVTFILSK
ncbi:MAG: D-aminoacyl-tRNA deacylase [bacterium]